MHGHPVPVLGAGRTDSGVHAMGQVSNFYTDIASIEAGRFLPAFNKLLPRDVRVLSASEADFDFHSRYDARLRRYRYFIALLCLPRPDTAEILPPRCAGGPISRRSTRPRPSSSARPTSRPFPRPRTRRRTASRYVAESSFRWEGEALVYEIAANAFLWRMVRSLVGSMLAYEAPRTRPH